MRDKNEKTPLMLAMGRHNEDIVTFLYRKQNRYIKFTLRYVLLVLCLVL